MPHTISGKTRSKRPDYRPNAKKRKQDRLKAVENADVSDLIKTRIHASARKERTVTGVLRGGDARGRPAKEAKRAKFLTKLLRQIESLRERKAGGDESLEAAQLLKIGRYGEVVREIEVLLNVDLGSSDEDEEEGDEKEDVEEGGDDDEEDQKDDGGDDDDVSHEDGVSHEGDERSKGDDDVDERSKGEGEGEDKEDDDERAPKAAKKASSRKKKKTKKKKKG